MQEVSLVDDPAVPDARYLIAKRRTGAPVPRDNMADTTTNESLVERIGKAVFGALGAAPADPYTQSLIAKSLAKAEEAEESEEAEEAAEEPAEEAEEAAAEESTEESEEAEEAPAEEAEEPAAEEAEESEEAPAEEPAEGEAEKAAPSVDTEALVASITESVKGLIEAEVAPLREALGKSLDATTDLAGRIETMEKRKGVSKGLMGAEAESTPAESTFESALF